MMRTGRRTKRRRVTRNRILIESALTGDMMKNPAESEDKNLKLQEFCKLLGLTATVSILKSVQKGEDQYRHFCSIASVATLNARIGKLVALRIIEHHIVREPKRKEWYTLTGRGKRIVEALIELEKAFRGE